MTNLRIMLGRDQKYSMINREERNLTAILYHLLLLKDNLRKFFGLINNEYNLDEKEWGIYYEYAFIRDLWFKINGNDREENNNKKREYIENSLGIETTNGMGIEEFNNYFGAVPKGSKEYIQSPGTWNLSRFKGINDINEKQFLEVCKFKWAFNAKPDIVIHKSKNEAICIEAKLESIESKYPQNPKEREIFKNKFGENWKDKLVKQTILQEYLMQNILEINTQFIVLSKKESSLKNHYSWNEVFETIKYDECPAFIKDVINRCKRGDF